VSWQGQVPSRSWDVIQADSLNGNGAHLAARRRTVGEVNGLLKAIEGTERYSNSGKSRIWRHQCLGPNCNGAIVERSIHSVRTSVRDGRCPACPKCLVPVKDGTKSKKHRRKTESLPEGFEPMGKHCGYCAGIGDRRPVGGVCKGCKLPHVTETFRATSTGLGGNPWMDGGPWL
jgi:hypothetical protein